MGKRAALSRPETFGLRLNLGVTGASIGQLARLTGRKVLELGQTWVSRDGVERLRNRLPGCEFRLSITCRGGTPTDEALGAVNGSRKILPGGAY